MLTTGDSSAYGWPVPEIRTPTVRITNARTMPPRKRSWGGTDDDRFLTDRKQRMSPKDTSTECEPSRFSTPKKSRNVLKNIKQTILDAPDVSRKRPSKLIDFNASSDLVVALGNSVFVKHDENVYQVLESEMTITAVAWADSDILIAASGHVELWDPDTSTLDSILEGHEGDVTCCSFIGHRVATGGEDGQVKITDIATSECTTVNTPGPVQDVQWSPDGCHLAAFSEGCIKIWGSDREETIYEPNIGSIAWKTPSILVVGSSDAEGTIKIYQIPKAKVMKQFTTGSRIMKVACSPKLGIFVAHAKTYNWELWTYKGQLDGKFVGTEDDILDMVLAKDDTKVAIISTDETLRIYSFASPRSPVSSPFANSFGGMLR